MTSVKNHLLIIILICSVNIAFANSLPEELANVCGERSCDIIFKKINKFAKNGSPHAQAVLALFYRGGYGTEIDNERSLKYMKRAAKNNLPFAQYELGMLYRLGHTVKKDEAASELWLKRSAKAGYDPAIQLLLSENKLSKEEQMAFEKKRPPPAVDEDMEVIVVTREQYTLSDLVDFLNSLGFGRNKNTGSRIRGQGCSSSSSSCVTWVVNSPLGRAQFNTMISNMNAMQTAMEMGGRAR